VNESKIKYNITTTREEERIIYNLKNIDKEYVIYYDETNNIRKFWFKDETGLNIPIEDLTKNFVLGGLFHKKNNINFNIKDLKNKLRLQKSIKEVKLEHIAKGDFLSCLKSKRLEIFLDWLESSNLNIHYMSLNIVYWSLVDIIDSIIDEQVRSISFELKTILYEIVKINLECFLQILYDFDYPNVKKDYAKNFLSELSSFIQKYQVELLEKYPTYNRDLISIIISYIERANTNDLNFIMDEQDHVLIDGFFHFYLKPLGLFKNSQHIFDEEYDVEKEFDKYELYDEENLWNNFEFRNSKDDDIIQFSDVIVGLLGKMYDYINNLDYSELDNIRSNLYEIQTKNFSTLSRLLHRSEIESGAFAHTVQGLAEREKFYTILEQFH